MRTKTKEFCAELCGFHTARIASFPAAAASLRLKGLFEDVESAPGGLARGG